MIDAHDGQVEPATRKQLSKLNGLATKYGYEVRDIYTRESKSRLRTAILFVWDIGDYAEYFTLGFFFSEERAVNYCIEMLKEHGMNLHKNNDLYPHIKAGMMKKTRVTLTLSGEVKIIKNREGSGARAELFFSDHEKSAIVNTTQLDKIIEAAGKHTEKWPGTCIDLYGEFGKWFGKKQWGLRVENIVVPSRQPTGGNDKAKSPTTQEGIPFDDPDTGY